MADPVGPPAKAGPVQTGWPGRPPPPWVVSAGLAGPLTGTGRVDLPGAGQALRTVLETLKVQHRQRGWLRWDTWGLLRATPEGLVRSTYHQDGEVPAPLWQDALDRIGSGLDSVVLSSGTWATLELGGPAGTVRGRRDVSLATAQVEVPAEGLVEATAALLDVVRDGFGAATGYVHVDSIADPYGQVTDHSRLSRNDFTTQVHGYYWAVRLGPGHIRMLGGIDRISRQAPVEHVEVRDEDAGAPSVLAVLRRSAGDLDEAAFRQWRSFLMPVLREGYPVGLENLAIPGILARPVWLYEGAPVSDEVPEILQFGETLGDGGPRLVVADWLSDPERPTCWLYPSAGDATGAGAAAPGGGTPAQSASPGPPAEEMTAAVDAVVNAWWQTGLAGKLHALDGQLHGCTNVSWQIDDDGVGAWAWQVELGDVDPQPALRLMARALGTVPVPLDHLLIA